MKVTVSVKTAPTTSLGISTAYIKLQDAMKLADLVPSGGQAKVLIQEGQVQVNGEVCTMRGRKLYPGDRFAYEGREYRISSHS